ncbi:unnamed protein product [Allacma fusca]|uniref:Uncharacterized protein n=1 Tax=Allacma fusca TaxID=39272 RepID=A0A8J2KA11_9HEXA|nr:unnamed protein product [Allacma fusca]
MNYPDTTTTPTFVSSICAEQTFTSASTDGWSALDGNGNALKRPFSLTRTENGNTTAWNQCSDDYGTSKNGQGTHMAIHHEGSRTAHWQT